MIITEPPATSGVPWGVRLALAWAGFVLAFALLDVVRNLVLLPSPLPYDAVQVVQAVLAGTLGVGVIVLVCRRVDHRSLASIGLGPLPGSWRALAAGAACWFALAALGLGVAVAVHAFPVEVRAPGWGLLGWLLLRMVQVLGLEALPEEIALRGYVLTTLREHVPTWVAVVGQAIVFTLWAYAGNQLARLFGFPSSWEITLDRTVLFVSFGLTLALVRLWTGSLWGSIGFHFAFQVVTQLLAADRLVISVPAGFDRDTAMIFLWFFPVVVGGIVALVGAIVVGRRRRADRPRPANSCPTRRPDLRTADWSR